MKVRGGYMSLSNLIEQYIYELLEKEDYATVSRNDLAVKFSCVPSQINYVISTRFNPELGFYVESRRGGSGYIKIIRTSFNDSEYLKHIISEMNDTLSPKDADIYINALLNYNLITSDEAKLIKIAISDKSLENVNKSTRDKVRSDIFKCLLINII